MPTFTVYFLGPDSLGQSGAIPSRGQTPDVRAGGRVRGPVFAPHFGQAGIGIEKASPTWPSDSFFAALIAQAAYLGQSGLTFIEDMSGDDPPVRHSSLFPAIGTLILLPRPALDLRFAREERRADIGKGFKKVRWLSPTLFRAVCAGEDLESYRHLTLQHGEVWISAQEAKTLPEPWRLRDVADEGQRAQIESVSIWQYESVPHVGVDRISNTSNYYEVGRVFFADACGLAFVARVKDTTRLFFESLIQVLGESGIGGRRTTGHGTFRIIHQQSMTFPDYGSGAVVTLSRVIPAPEEVTVLSRPGTRYQLVEVGGWGTAGNLATFRRKEVTMIAEGGVFASRIRGQLVDVRSDTFQPRPDHPVWRSGLALTIPVQSGDGRGSA